MFEKVWCYTAVWRRLFIVALLLHAGFNILFFDNYISLWETALFKIELFDSSLFYYFINYLPVLELSLGLLLLFGYIRKIILGVAFYIFLIGGYYALDSNQLLSFLVWFSLAFFSLFVLFGHYYKTCDDKKDAYNIPTGGV
ncbi:hypothetical protein E7Z59_13790 [Robertkochia marina]|uniref:Uncharacterized protein n=1 Tax=Robertkochia marina TaxID=1227945 RepID=A0A4V3UXU1_9FLAO|nr:hypothetical protein [Robertkochia marina]THD65660.1 hypothetical protein E7Z59_13790 [Robertkochia marina]TRZ46659.1 hypothetical protein D3A96_03575 [Robertkochia marina]